ncbi:putative DNA-binding transcriptional regulator AlpA [Kitasatospora sp. GP30]|uniref:hypothetical protein n=1 Tax=Kitasatospora sp. GP30 TaxID=3035084 RepID=UPI000CB4E327|nr:hypothetical protein [Kitasatospora sp. GP30]MDH6144156.1 putative DNA-binding transcriptional regulator AlpA [Kitasatospora sp. GP30]
MATPTSGGMSATELLALPVAIDLDTANRALGIGRSTGYALAKAGTYPAKVLRLGGAYRVVTADLLLLLGVARSGEAIEGQGVIKGRTAHELCA